MINPEILRAARDMLPNPEASVASIAKLLGVSPGTLYNHIPELRAAGRARAAAITAPRRGVRVGGHHGQGQAQQRRAPLVLLGLAVPRGDRGPVTTGLVQLVAAGPDQAGMRQRGDFRRRS
ncbi:HTH domain-containing protein [Micromonospora olivasterospora]|uniref:HTH domain-containing protein n=1 Tax=Micromonospora olivasterospora TaxID=1880 RepID=UPI001FEA30C1|nr:HTH domain-containing protein [Micromonospora olivasterospora]